MKLAGKPALAGARRRSRRRRRPSSRSARARRGAASRRPIPNPTGAVGVDALVQGQADRQPARLPAESVHAARHGPPVRAQRHAARARRRDAAEVRLRPRHSRALPAARRTSTPGASRAQFGDEGHRQGWCLYHLGCKGPDTHAGCSTRHFNEVVDAWPIGIGAPCIGCTEKKLAFRVPMFQVIPIHDATPPGRLCADRVAAGRAGASPPRASSACRRGRAARGGLRRLAQVLDRAGRRERARYEPRGDASARSSSAPARAEETSHEHAISRRQRASGSSALGGRRGGGRRAGDAAARRGAPGASRGRRPTPWRCSTTTRSAPAARPACRRATRPTACRPTRRSPDGLWQLPRRPQREDQEHHQALPGADERPSSAFVKRQCMHCLDPACVAGCPFDGPREEPLAASSPGTPSRCIGCRYCEVACPFDVPKFEWDRLNPQDREVRVLLRPAAEQRRRAGLHRGLSRRAR